MSLKQNIESTERLVSVIIKGLDKDPDPILVALSKATKKDRLAALEMLYDALVIRVKRAD